MKKLYQQFMQFILAKPDGPEALDMAMENLMEKAQSGDADAEYEIGRRYFVGEYYHQDIPAGLRWLELAAKQHHTEAQSLLCQYYYPRLNIYPNYTEAVINWSAQAAHRQDIESLAIWGEILITGLGSQTASADCIFYLQKAANHHHLRASYLLGTLYLHGKWVAQDLEKARYWIERTAKQDYIPSQQILSDMYRQGIGVSQSTTEADFWQAQWQKSQQTKEST